MYIYSTTALLSESGLLGFFFSSTFVRSVLFIIFCELRTHTVTQAQQTRTHWIHIHFFFFFSFRLDPFGLMRYWSSLYFSAILVCYMRFLQCLEFHRHRHRHLYTTLSTDIELYRLDGTAFLFNGGAADMFSYRFCEYSRCDRCIIFFFVAWKGGTGHTNLKQKQQHQQ